MILLQSLEGNPLIISEDISITLYMSCHIIITLYRPLLYGLSIVENFTALRSYEFESKDYQITPGSPWNYAIHLSSDPEKTDMSVTVDGLKPPLPPFSQQGAPVKIQAKVYKAAWPHPRSLPCSFCFTQNIIYDEQ